MKTITSTNYVCNELVKGCLELNISISDVILTPLTCASLVNELLKGILYQKSQIPYPYSRLKTVINKRRKKPDEQKFINYTVENYFRNASKTFDVVEEIMEAITLEFKSNEKSVKEILIMVGVTPHCPKEVFKIRISDLAYGHIERNHMSETNSLQNKILRNVFLSQSWIDAVDVTPNCSNTYIFIKKEMVTADEETKYFQPCKPVHLPSKIKKFNINLNYNDCSLKSSCCDNLSVFQDLEGSSQQVKKIKLSENDLVGETEQWYQAKDLIKGFKDCFVNKVSASELW